MARRPANTRERLLEVACKAFANKGFHDTTIAEICRQAQANIAAVNYHFGSKEHLYVEAWRHAHRRLWKANPPDGGVGPDAPPAERLRGRVRSLVQGAMGSDAVAFRIMSHETANPTGLLKEVFRESIRPLREMTESIVAELLGEQADEQAVRLCGLCVTAPCLRLLAVRRMRRHLGRSGRIKPDVSSEELADHFAAFALAGIEGIRQRLADAKGPQDASGAAR